jgi:hypothetical protein
MAIPTSKDQLLHSIKSLCYTTYRMAEKDSCLHVTVLTQSKETVFELDEPIDAKDKAKLRMSLDDFKTKMSHRN